MPFDEKGLLGRAATAWAQENRNRYRSAFRDLEELNSACLAYLGPLTIRNGNGKHMVAVGLFSQCLELFASIVILLERGLANSSRALLRSFLEATLNLGAVAADDEFWQLYIRQDELRRLKTVNRVRNSNAPHVANLKKRWATDELLKEIEQEIATHKIKRISTEQVAKRAGMTQFYDTMYTGTCLQVVLEFVNLPEEVVTRAAAAKQRLDELVNDADVELPEPPSR